MCLSISRYFFEPLPHIVNTAVINAVIIFIEYPCIFEKNDIILDIVISIQIFSGENNGKKQFAARAY